jgi:hypothetical protein
MVVVIVSISGGERDVGVTWYGDTKLYEVPVTPPCPSPTLPPSFSQPDENNDVGV